ncbi:ABC transporter permease [Candidatus Latescibacterota bacterium]
MTPKIEHKPEVLEILSTGITGQFASTVEVSRTKMPEFKAGNTIDNEYLATVSEIDISMVTAIVFSLLGLLLGFDAVNGERRTGTLKYILSNQVPRFKLLLSKCLGGIAVIILSLIIGFIFCLILMLNSSGIALNLGLWLRIGGFFVTSLLYASTFYMLGILLSVSFKEPAAALAFSLFFWVVLVVIWPGTARYLGKQLIPVQTLESMKENDGFKPLEIQEVLKLWGDFSKAENLPDFFDLGNDGSFSFGGSGEIYQSLLDYLYDRVDIVQEEVQKQTDREWQIRSAHYAYMMKQQNFIHLISCISPAYLFDYTSSILCRTDSGSYGIFIDNVNEYRRQFLQWLVDIDAMHSQKWFVQDGDLDLSGLPEYSPISESFVQSLNRAAIPAAMLILINLVFFFCAHLIFFRSDV